MASAIGPGSSSAAGSAPQDAAASLVYDGFDSLNLLASVSAVPEAVVAVLRLMLHQRYCSLTCGAARRIRNASSFSYACRYERNKAASRVVVCYFCPGSPIYTAGVHRRGIHAGSLAGGTRNAGCRLARCIGCTRPDPRACDFRRLRQGCPFDVDEVRSVELLEVLLRLVTSPISSSALAAPTAALTVTSSSSA